MQLAAVRLSNQAAAAPAGGAGRRSSRRGTAGCARWMALRPVGPGLRARAQGGGGRCAAWAHPRRWVGRGSPMGLGQGRLPATKPTAAASAAAACTASARLASAAPPAAAPHRPLSHAPLPSLLALHFAALRRSARRRGWTSTCARWAGEGVHTQGELGRVKFLLPRNVFELSPAQRWLAGCSVSQHQPSQVAMPCLPCRWAPQPLIWIRSRGTASRRPPMGRGQVRSSISWMSPYVGLAPGCPLLQHPCCRSSCPAVAAAMGGTTWAHSSCAILLM